MAYGSVYSRIEGADRLKAALINKVDRHIIGFERGIIAACKFILAESQKLVPVDTGALKASGKYTIYGGGVETEGIVSYGGSNLNPVSGLETAMYAIVVHEDVTVNHTNGQAKFLEQPMRQHRKKISTIVRKEMVKR